MFISYVATFNGQLAKQAGHLIQFTLNLTMHLSGTTLGKICPEAA